MPKYIPTSEKVTVENYPYGFRLRTTLFDTIEFDAKKGYRHVTQTINPKTGKENKPKKDVYYSFLIRYYDENNHIKTKGINLGGEIGINESAKFISEIFDTLSIEEREFLYLNFLSATAVNMKASVLYQGAKIEDLKPFYEANITALKEGLKSKGEINTFDRILFDREAIEKTFPSDYEPFRVKKF